MGPTVLLVERDPAEREQVMGALRQGCPDCLFGLADSLPAASALLQALAREVEVDPGRLPDLLVVNLDLASEQEGQRLLSWIRLQHALRSLPVVCYTHHGGRTVTAAYAAGTSSCLLRAGEGEAFLSRLAAICHYWTCEQSNWADPSGSGETADPPTESIANLTRQSDENPLEKGEQG